MSIKKQVIFQPQIRNVNTTLCSNSWVMGMLIFWSNREKHDVATGTVVLLHTWKYCTALSKSSSETTDVLLTLCELLDEILSFPSFALFKLVEYVCKIWFIAFFTQSESASESCARWPAPSITDFVSVAANKTVREKEYVLIGSLVNFRFASDLIANLAAVDCIVVVYIQFFFQTQYILYYNIIQYNIQLYRFYFNTLLQCFWNQFHYLLQVDHCILVARVIGTFYTKAKDGKWHLCVCV